MPECPQCGTAVPEPAALCLACARAGQSAAAPDPVEAEWRRSGVDRVLQELRAALAPRYELERPLGAGGMGAVLLAREPALQRQVAVKVLSPILARDDAARARFQREGRAVAAISHPNVVGVYGVGETPTSALPYLVMQYVEGQPLDAWLGQHGRPSGLVVRRIVGEVAAALAAAHARNLAHRDIKPGNILIEKGSGRALVVDFGVSALLQSYEAGTPRPTGQDPRITGMGEIVGTPVYMSPEQAAADVVDARSDVYSLGVMAFELVTGHLPFQAASVLGWAAAHMGEQPPRLAEMTTGLSPDVARLLDQCLAKTPAERPTAAELARALLPNLEAELVWPPPSLLPLQRLGQKLRRATLAGAVAALLLALALAFPPRAVSAEAGWWEDYAVDQEVRGSTLGVVRAPGRTGPERWILLWQALLVGSGVATVAAFGAGLVIAARAASLVRQGRARGWRSDTLLDVAADPDGRTGLLVGEGNTRTFWGEVALTRLHQARRVALRYSVLAAAYALFVLGGWAVSAMAGIWPLRGARPILGALGFALLAGPCLVLLAQALLARRLSARESRALPLAPVTVEMPTPLPVADDANLWYASRDGLGAPGRAPAHGPPAALPWLAVVPGLALIGATAFVAATVLVAGRRLASLGPSVAELASRVRIAESIDPLAVIRGLVGPWLPPTTTVPDDSLRTWLRGLRDTSATPPFAITPANLLAQLDTSDGTLAARAATALRHVTAAGLPSAVTDIEGHPRLLLLRRLARAATPALQRMSAEVTPELPSAGDLPFSGLREAAQGNALAAMAAVVRGDTAAAGQRLGENAALAMRLMQVPRLFTARYAVGLLQDLALLPLAALAERQGNMSLADSLRAAAEALREDVFSPAWDDGFTGLGSDPVQPSLLLDAAGNSKLPLGLRAQAMSGALGGACLNARELLAGIDPARAELERRVATAVFGTDSGSLVTVSRPSSGASSAPGLHRGPSGCS